MLKRNLMKYQYPLRSTNTRNLFVPRPNSIFMKRTLHYSTSSIILWNALLSNLKTVKKCIRHLQKEIL